MSTQIMGAQGWWRDLRNDFELAKNLANRAKKIKLKSEAVSSFFLENHLQLES